MGNEHALRRRDWFCLLFTWASSARASTAVVVLLIIDVATSPENVEAATAELTRLIRVHGFDVISPGQAEASNT